ncbi:hypothetical protein PDESU_03416 [Pontiella desulfatans]|uniref:Uncharacterized protein n=1 Tax=Pontiella desulfatans TaxID=2750659 RepID=A0A6C2U625_PONDE|nr:hypothetical protein PDESU_03416 [Pontiella desulfatans]
MRNMLLNRPMEILSLLYGSKIWEPFERNIHLNGLSAGIDFADIRADVVNIFVLISFFISVSLNHGEV